MSEINVHIFREYDIRGVAENDLHPTIIEDLGRACGKYYRRNGVDRIALGRDCRLSSPRLRENLLKGLLSTGCHVLDIGMVPTPVLYYALFNLDVQGGVQITGSHNPPDNNGFKVCLGKSTIYGEEIQELRRIIESKEFPKGEGTLSKKDVIEGYKGHILRTLSTGQIKRKVVVDAGNGTGGMVAPSIYREMGMEVEELFCEPDGNFPNHHPDPTIPANLESLIEKVALMGADLGIAMDGDADRIGVVDDKGNIIWGDQLMILFTREILKERPGSTFIGEVKCSQSLFDDIAQRGGKPIMWKVGHSLIKAKMKEEGALFAGEMSGHIFFADRYYGYDDAVYAGARLLELLSRNEGALSGMLSDLPSTVNTPEIRMECPDEEKFGIVEHLVEVFKKDHEVNDVDGARIRFPDGWGLVRASNTQPALVLRFEASSEEALKRIRSEVESRLRERMPS